MIRKIFRYKLISIYFIISQLIVFTAVFGVLQIYNKAFDKERDRLNALAEHRIELEIMSLEYRDILSNAGSQVENGNVLAGGKISTEFTEAGAATRCEVILAVNEELPYPMISGRIPGVSENDYGQNIVALGRDKYKYAYERNGKHYVTLDNTEYEVVGIIGSSRSDYWDYKIVFNINCVSENTKKRLSTFQNQLITVSSNKGDITDSYEIVYKNIKAVDLMNSIVPYKRNSKGESTVETTLGKENVKVNIIVYIFCLLNCVIMSVFWIIQRRKELMIKKIFGFSNFKIIKEILVDIVTMISVSVIIFALVYGFYRIFQESGKGFVISFNAFSVISTAAMIVITILITMIYPIYKVCNQEPAKIGSIK